MCVECELYILKSQQPFITKEIASLRRKYWQSKCKLSREKVRPISEENTDIPDTIIQKPNATSGHFSCEAKCFLSHLGQFELHASQLRQPWLAWLFHDSKFTHTQWLSSGHVFFRISLALPAVLLHFLPFLCFSLIAITHFLGTISSVCELLNF